MRTAIPTAYLSPLLPLAFTFGAGNVREVAASGGSTKDRAFLKAKRKLRRGKECSPSFQIEKNADETDIGVLKTCPGDKDCVEDITSSLGGRCVDSAMSSESITSLSQGQLHGVDEARRLQGCTFANGTTGIKCDGEGACAQLPADAKVGCGSCNGNLACGYMGSNATIAENSCVGVSACRYIKNATIADNSCVGRVSACGFMGDATIADNSCVGEQACREMGNATIAEKSCVGDQACAFMGNDVLVNENSCVGEQACDKLIGTGENSTDIGENSW